MKMNKHNGKFDLASIMLFIGTFVVCIYRQEFLAVLCLVATIGLIAIMIIYSVCSTNQEASEEYADELADLMFEEALKNADIRVKQQLYIVYGKGYE